MRCARSSSRSRIASAMVGSPSPSCQLVIGSCLMGIIGSSFREAFIEKLIVSMSAKVDAFLPVLSHANGIFPSQ